MYLQIINYIILDRTFPWPHVVPNAAGLNFVRQKYSPSISHHSSRHKRFYVIETTVLMVVVSVPLMVTPDQKGMVIIDHDLRTDRENQYQITGQFAL